MEISIIIIILILIVVVAALIIYYLITMGNKRKVEEVEELPRPRHRGELQPFDEDMEEALYRRRFSCPDCGEEVGPFDEDCPACGAILKVGEFECSNCGKTVDPRDRECPYCGEILTPEPYVCPNCSSPVEPDSTKCDSCGARFWSPILLDEVTLKKRTRPVLSEEEKKENEEINEVEKEMPERRSRSVR